MLVNQFLQTLEAKNRSKNTLESIREVLPKAETFLGKPLENATYDDLLKYMESLKNVGLNTNSLSLRGSQIVQFLKFCLNQTDDEKYNRLIRKFKDVTAERQKNDINPTELLTYEDVKRLINVSTMERDRCIIAVLYESGMRIGELMALRVGMVELNEQRQDVSFHIPNLKGKGTKTGSRTVVCLEVFGYVQDWLKCHPNPIPTQRFINISQSGVDKQMRRLVKRAGINKPANLHNFRHSAITNACILKMQPYDISMRFWGIPNSNMFSVYIHLSQQVQADAYRDAKGMGGGNGNTVINPLASRCVNCGRLIQAGSLCKPCADTKKLEEENNELKAQMQQQALDLDTLRRQMELISAAMQAKNAL
jgi:site-specific recombinase XerD